MALSLANLCSRRGKTSALPQGCGNSTSVSEYDLKTRYGVTAPEAGALYFLTSDPADAAPVVAIQAELTTRLSRFIVDNCVMHLFQAVADLQAELSKISARLRVVIKGGLSMYIGVLALAAAAGEDPVEDIRRLVEDGVFAPSDLDTQIVWIGQDDILSANDVLDVLTFQQVDKAVIRVLGDLNEKLRLDTRFDGFISSLASERGVTRAAVSSDIKIESVPGRVGNAPDRGVPLVKVTRAGMARSPYFVSSNASIERFHLWRNKLMVGYTRDCDIKLELLDVSMVKKSTAESKTIVRGVFGASAETDLVARELAAQYKYNLTNPTAARGADNIHISNAIDICNGYHNPPNPAAVVYGGARYTLDRVLDSVTTYDHPPRTVIDAVLASIVAGDAVVEAAKRQYGRRGHISLRLKTAAGGYEMVAVCDLEFNAMDVVKVILHTLLSGGGANVGDLAKLAKRMKRLVFLALVSTDVLEGSDLAKRFLLFFFEATETRERLGLQTLPEPSGVEVLQTIMEKIPDFTMNNPGITEYEVVTHLKRKIADAGLLDDDETTRTALEVIHPIMQRLSTNVADVRSSFQEVQDDVFNDGTVQLWNSPLFTMDCKEGGRVDVKLENIIRGGGGGGGGGGGAAVADGYGLWAAALMSVVAAVGAGAGAAARAAKASGPG